ncbi:TOPRIM nucleotidyl transferase/hydrolase domain-containing protein [Micromonospora sp. DT47]|uniref:TOPRIM nucleotidyl transferase/hydrolase domain-containing protein n=1 Tax=Micromonospora sp. DT47 TaxID=3393431 RepID=UPI003CED115E
MHPQMNQDLATDAGAHTIVLVEGTSDRHAVETLARRRDRSLEAEGVRVVPMGGATNVGHFLRRFGPGGLDVRISGLCDAAEEGWFRRALGDAGLGGTLSRGEMAARGFHVCVADLEDELIRCLGTDRVERVAESQGELASFRLFQRQPAQRGRGLPDQLHRFIGTRSGRKHRYAGLLVDALDPDRVPEPLDRLLGGL